jgi:hypothetical protein
MSLTICLTLAAATVLQAQQPAGPAFAVVSIRPAEPGARGGPGPFVNTEPGRLIARGTLRFFVLWAYGVQDFQISGGPDWAATRATTSRPRSRRARPISN